jgi:hypothetical protein
LFSILHTLLFGPFPFSWFCRLYAIEPDFLPSFLPFGF